MTARSAETTEADGLPEPPAAPRREHVRVHHGDRVSDPYEWLRDKEDPAVLAHLEAENAYAEARTAHLAPLRQRIFDEIRSRTQETDLSVPVADGPWWYFSRTVEGEQYALFARVSRREHPTRPALEPGVPAAGEHVLLDMNEMARGEDFFALGALGVSPDHRLLASAVDVTGDERFDLTVTDAATGEVVDDAVTGIGYGCAFSLDGRHLFYTRVDEAWRPHQVWRHRVGGPAAEDVLVHEEPDERFWMGLDTSRDDRHVLILLGSKTTSEAWILDAADPTGEFRCVAPRREGVEYDVEPAGDRLLVVHNTDNPDSDLAWAPLDATSHEQWHPVLGSAEGERLLGVDAFDGFAVLSLRSGGLPALRVLRRDPDGPTGFVPADRATDVGFEDEIASVHLGDTPDPAATRIQVVHESYVTPRSIWDVDVATGDRELLRRQPVLGGYDPAAYTTHREWVTAEDGTLVPLSVVARAGAVPDGTHPALLTAYGSYEASSDPAFSIARLSLLERGVVYAVAHVRGGGEMGRAWYDDGKMLRKRNTFTDFVACAEHLHQRGWVASDRLAVEGGSAGGLLLGAALNLAPGLFRAVHAAVPFVDTLTTILKPELPLTVGEWEEWGDPLHDEAVYAYMKSYTPYENVRPEVYPAVLATTSLNDTRVYFTEPAKWVARLRETVLNDPEERPVLLRTEMVAGHGGRSGRYNAWEQLAWEWAFLLDQIGAADAADAADAVGADDAHERPVD